MGRLFVFYILFASIAVSAEPITLTYDSPWQSIGPNTWRMTFMHRQGSRAETIELTQSDDGLTFHSRVTCEKKGKFEMLTWKFKDRYATGTGCAGESVRINTMAWRNRVVPLPHEVAARYRD